MEVVPHFSHVHPLVFISGESSHKSEEINCCACGESVSGPRFSCMECGFHLHRNCAEAPAKMDHPFHRKHNLDLLTSPPFGEGNTVCDLCNKICDKFVYRCSSCDLHLHLKCAFLSYKFLQNTTLRESQLPELVNRVPPVSSESYSQELAKVECLACRKPLLDSDYISLESRFYLHKKCFELPLKINHLSHRWHSLSLQFNSDRLPCKICLETQGRGLVYRCLVCEFVLHIECVSPPLVIEDPSSHEHPFSRCLRELPFTCDACGTSGNHVSYICITCSIMVHKKCISILPRFIKNLWHEHPICHKYFVVDDECTTQNQDCPVCHKEVNMACGSYYCSKCKFTIHVNCALEDARDYYKIESRDEFEKAMSEADTLYPSFVVIKTIKVGEDVINTEIKHFSHPHHLVLSDQVKDQLYCDGCSQIVTASFYGCFDCEFFLHKSCANLPKKKRVLASFHQDPYELIPNSIFKCGRCGSRCTGFVYKCKIHLCDDHVCVRCVEIRWSYISQAHNHMLLFYNRYNGMHCCNACGDSTEGYSVYRCKACNFNLDPGRCINLPQIAWHKFDTHGLLLTYHEDSDYSEYRYCDICERERSPSTWFYHCSICDSSAHLDCVQPRRRYIKSGIKIKEEDHQHTLLFVQKVYDYPDRCCICGQHCSDLALECSEAGCKYIIHWECSTSFYLIEDEEEIISLQV